MFRGFRMRLLLNINMIPILTAWKRKNKRIIEKLDEKTNTSSVIDKINAPFLIAQQTFFYHIHLPALLHAN